MEPENEKYRRVLNILRNSKPELGSTYNIENEVFKRISKVKQPKINLSDLIDFLFGWVYIGWVRRSLITASILLVLVFVYQQSVILKRIDALGRQTVVNERANIPESADEIEKLLMVYRYSGRRFPSKTITISERQINELIKSINELQVKYKDLENLLKGDPELKELIEKKLIENNSTKTSL